MITMPKKKSTEKKREIVQEIISLTAEQIAELKVLLKQVEYIVNTINSPLAISTYLLSAKFLSKTPIIPELVKFIAQKIDQLEKENHSILAPLAFFLSLGGFLYLWYKLHKPIIKKINQLFPHGFTEPFHPEHESWDKARQLLNGQELAINIQDVIRSIKEDLDNNLMPRANKLMGFLVIVDVITKIFSISIPMIDQFYGSAIYQVYQSRHLIRDLINKKKYKSLVEHQIRKLNLLSCHDNWHVTEDEKLENKNKQYRHTQFTIRFPHRHHVVTIQVIDRISDQTIQIPAKKYIQELAITLRKNGYISVLAEGDTVLCVGNESLNDKKILQLRKDFIIRLNRRNEVQDQKEKKLKQLTRLLTAANGDAAWFALPKRDTNGLASIDFAIINNAIPEQLKADFLDQLCVLFGPQAIKEEYGSIFVRGHLCCDEKILHRSIEVMSEYARKLNIPTNNVKQTEPCEVNFTVVEKRKRKTIGVPTPQHERKETAAVDTTMQIRNLLKLGASEKIYPLRTPWTNGKDIYYAVLNREMLTDKLGEATFQQFENYFSNGKVQPYGGKGVGLFQCAKQYSTFNGTSEQAEIQAKNTRNIRLFGRSKQLIVHGVTKQIIKVDGLDLRAH